MEGEYKIEESHELNFLINLSLTEVKESHS